MDELWEDISLMTLTLMAIGMVIMAGTLMLIAGLMIWMAIRVAKVSAEIEELVTYTRTTVVRIDGIARTVEAGTQLVRQTLTPSLVRFGALVTGVKKGFEIFLNGTSS